jgi:hypothetical protein
MEGDILLIEDVPFPYPLVLWASHCSFRSEQAYRSH